MSRESWDFEKINKESKGKKKKMFCELFFVVVVVVVVVLFEKSILFHILINSVFGSNQSTVRDGQSTSTSRCRGCRGRRERRRGHFRVGCTSGRRVSWRIEVLGPKVLLIGVYGWQSG